MNRWWLKAALIAAFAGPAFADDPKTPAEPPKGDVKPTEKKDDEPKTPIEKFKALNGQMATVQKEFQAAIQAVRDKGEKPSLEDKSILAAYEKQNNLRTELSKVAFEAGKAEPKSKEGGDALVFAIQNLRGGMTKEEALANKKKTEEALDLMIEHNSDDIRLSSIAQSMRYNPSAKVMTTLEQIEAKSKNAEVVLSAKVTRGKILLGDKNEAKAAEGEKLLEKIMTESKDAKLGNRPVAKAIEGDLFEHRNLSVGKTVPEVEGEDADGAKFKISDYRGKVVMLDFWGHW
jgi:hypothetical protein